MTIARRRLRIMAPPNLSTLVTCGDVYEMLLEMVTFLRHTFLLHIGCDYPHVSQGKNLPR
jgi:hypothetical protein